MIKPYKQVKEFHKAFGHPHNDKPTIMDKETALARSVWKIEEIIEFLNASVGGDEEAFDELIARLMFGIQDAINKERGKKVDDILVAQADALTDLSYFNYGSFTILGVEPQALFDIVQNANMSKLGEDGKPIIREEDGKIMKPEDWQPPEPLIKEEIDKQILDYEAEGKF